MTDKFLEDLSGSAAPGGSQFVSRPNKGEQYDIPGTEADEAAIVSNSQRARTLTANGIEAQLQREERATTSAGDEHSSPTTASTASTSTTTTTTTTVAIAVAASQSSQTPLETAAAHGLRRPREFCDEDPSHPNWRTHHKHVFVLSQAGKPIYARYGDEQRMAPFMAAISAVISFVDDAKDVIRHFRAGNHDFVFLLKGFTFLCVLRAIGRSTTPAHRTYLFGCCR
jgi:hypothetical protein